MKRQLAEFEHHPFDIVIVGAGITGACLAFDAASRGLSTALIDKGDFGAATSAASSKLLHGGLRYLQQLRLGKLRESAFERVYFQNLAPHLTRYVPFVVPTYRNLAQGRMVLAGGMLAYRTLCLGQNRQVRDASKRVPSGRRLSVEQVRDFIPGIGTAGLTGGRLFYESHMHSSERMTLAFVDGAARHGAEVANYVAAERFVIEHERVVGVGAVDVLSGRQFEVRGSVVVNAAGPWIGALSDELGGRVTTGIVTGFSRGTHIVTRPLTGDHAVALPTQRKNQSVISRGGRHVFIIPWRGKSLIGTTYEPHDGDLDNVNPSASEVQGLVDEINAALGPGTLENDDVLHSFSGLYPLVDEDLDPDTYQGTGDYQVVDHQTADGLGGLFSVFGAKYTTARRLAERALDRITEKLGGEFGACRTRRMALPAGDIGGLDSFRRECERGYREVLSGPQVDHLIGRYGTDISGVVDLLRRRPELGEPLAPERGTLEVEAVWAVRHEMAAHLEDFVFRRTGLGTLGSPGQPALVRAAQLMASELGWDEVRQGLEIERVRSRFRA